MIELTREQVGEDLTRLAETDLQAAQLKRAVEAHDYLLKKHRYIAFLAADGNIEERKAQAELDEKYQEQVGKKLDSIEASEAIQNERKTLQLRIEVWRSVNANRRQAS